PEEEDSPRFFPQRLALAPVEVEGIDVLILFRWILRVLDGPVRTVVEPLRMLGHPGMIRRALERVVQRDLQPMLPGGPEERSEIRQRPECRFDRLVPSVLVADSPRGAGIVGTGLEGVVPALPEASPDRMDRRQVEHVEPHARDV